MAKRRRAQDADGQRHHRIPPACARLAKVGQQADTVVIGNGARHPRPYATERPGAGHLSRHAGPRQAGRQPGQDDRVGLSTSRTIRPASRCACPTCVAPTRAASGRVQPSVVRAKRTCQGHPRGACDWWAAVPSATVPTSSCTIVSADGCSKIICLDGLAELDHCWNAGNDYSRPCATRHRVHVRAASVAENDCLLADVISPSTPSWKRTTSPATLQRPVQPALPGTSASSRGRVLQRLRDRLQDRRAPRTAEEYTGGKTSPS